MVRKLLVTTCGFQFLQLLFKYLTKELCISGQEAPPMYMPHVAHIHTHTRYIQIHILAEREADAQLHSTHEEHFGLQVCIVPSMTYLLKSVGYHITTTLSNSCIQHGGHFQKIFQPWEHFGWNPPLSSQLFVLALTLSRHYKCTYFQLTDCSSQPSVLCHACFCLRFSLQYALPQKVLPTNHQVPPFIDQETTNPATERAFQALLVEHQSAFKYLL